MRWCRSPGAAGSFPPQQIAEWREVVHSPPETHGVAGSRWTLRGLRKAVLAWAAYSLSGLWRLLKAIGLCYKRGRQYVHSPDPEYMTKRDFVQSSVEQAQREPERIVTCYLTSSPSTASPRSLRTGTPKVTLNPWPVALIAVIGTIASSER